MPEKSASNRLPEKQERILNNLAPADRGPVIEASASSSVSRWERFRRWLVRHRTSTSITYGGDGRVWKTKYRRSPENDDGDYKPWVQESFRQVG